MKLLITGAAGRIGSSLTHDLADRYDLRLTDVHRPDDVHDQRFVPADISDMDALRSLCTGVDTVIHLAADPSMDAPWDSVLPRNVVGTYNLFEAAYRARCRRVIFASSVNAVAGYPPDVQVHASMPVRPPNLYGATKAWGEALARFYADQRELSMLCLRFGWVIGPDEAELRPDHPNLSMALTYADLTRLVVAGIEAPADLRFGIFHGVSNNRWKRLDISDAREVLGYAPQDDAFALAERRT
jgi:nucleoside-diphosphate-sugar epimerase